MIFFYLMFFTTTVAAQSLDSSKVVRNTNQYSSELNLFMSTVKVIFALALTLVLLVATVWVLKKLLRYNKLPGFSAGAITILEMRYIAPKKAIALVSVLEKVYIIVFSEQTVMSLGELSTEDAEQLVREQKPEINIFKNLLSGFVKKKDSMTGNSGS